MPSRERYGLRTLRRYLLRAIRAFSVAALATGLLSSSSFGAEPWITEPIFGLYFDPSKVHFDHLPVAEMLPSCKQMLLEYKPLPKSLTLYARSRNDATRIYIAGARDILGVYVIRNGACEADVPILALLKKNHVPPTKGDTPLLTDDEISGLFADALTRYARAFGGKDKFLQWLDSLTEKMRKGCQGKPALSCPPTYHILLPPQQKQLEEYRKR